MNWPLPLPVRRPPVSPWTGAGECPKEQILGPPRTLGSVRLPQGEVEAGPQEGPAAVDQEDPAAAQMEEEFQAEKMTGPHGRAEEGGRQGPQEARRTRIVEEAMEEALHRRPHRAVAEVAGGIGATTKVGAVGIGAVQEAMCLSSASRS